MTDAAYGTLPEVPRQLLPPEAYYGAEWFGREQRDLFGRSWVFAGVMSDLAEPGDFLTAQAGPFPLAAVRDSAGDVRGFHNICRHRGTELLEGRGNAGNTITCPYHAWCYGLQGGLIAVPDRKECFPDLDLSQMPLHPAGIGVFGGMIFLHPDPEAAFDAWTAALAGAGWPHDIAALHEAREITYEINCNWKVFYENAIDGYHLKYLHWETLGGPAPNANCWDPHGDHLVWYSTEIERAKTVMPYAVAEYLESAEAAKIAGTEAADYGGVYMMFPTTIALPNPYNFSVTKIIPAAPEKSLLQSRVWGPPGSKGRASQDIDASEDGRDPVDGRVKLTHLQVHPKESGDFQLEDMWICEKVQRALHSPRYAVSALARGAGAETPLAYFQRQVLGALER